LHAAGRVDPTWATATEHTTTAISAGLVASVPRGTPFRQRFPKPRQLPAITLVGLTGLGGDLAYATASQHGALTSVSAISSLYPITTIALSIVIQHHRPERTQAFGIVLALIGAATLGAATP
jgi:drug/metabolite transporter (DMT)-like permease